ncbi:hypothetical protein GCM10014713_35680 [Streptomyces purpureus]|uniref:DJ-1/PfpI domain-containing protein n=2 Tax=Streptomyces purpureus TaxID=1951 RepID=A0A918H4V7_9ACTN|nr:hypothetical protein GCM10014713_35680 [Streptomyces purpureus]
MIRDNEEFDVVVKAVTMVGSFVTIETAEGVEGFIDQVMHPSWWSEEVPPPEVGDRLHVVVLDASRTPPRLSALERDIETGRRIRSGELTPPSIDSILSSWQDAVISDREAAMTSTAPRKTVHLAVYDALADWETGHATAWLARSGFEIRTVGPSTAPVTSIGGLRITPDLALEELTPEDSALLILPGGDLWDEGDDLAPFAAKAREFLDAKVPVAAICGATAGLAREGLLDDRRHTSAVSFYLSATGYQGGEHYVDADAVTDGDLITAGPTEPVAFGREVLGRLGAFEGAKLDAWYRLFHDSDPAAYEELNA